MQHFRLKNTNDSYFNSAWKLYENSFPIEERRLLDSQSNIMKKANYHFDIFCDKKQLIGFILWWEFETINFIDHFATLAEFRNQGFGESILKNFIKRISKPIILEVELPNSIIKKRRINFYERIGFKINQYFYEMPPLRENELPLELLLMSYPTLLCENDVKQFIYIYLPIIFNK